MTTPMIDHDATPPHDPDAEAQTIGAIIQGRTWFERAAAITAGPEFYRPQHQSVWEAVQLLRSEGAPIDPVTVQQKLGGMGLNNLRSLVAEVLTACATPEAVEYHAARVHETHMARSLATLGQSLYEQAMKTSDAVELAARATQRIQQTRELGGRARPTRSLEQILEVEDDPYDWVIPGLMERGDRLVLTGGEGGGKSTLLRQLAICAAAGIHPFSMKRIQPVRVLIIDAENSERQFRRKTRQLVISARQHGEDPVRKVHAEFYNRIDLRQDRMVAEIQHRLDETKADLLLIGPFYRLFPGSINSEDDAGQALTALDTLRERCALVLEAHAGHAKDGSGDRAWRPRGSSTLMGWPEFGYGIAPDDDAPVRSVDLKAWRGDRDEREWPARLKAGGIMPWTPDLTAENDVPPPSYYEPETGGPTYANQYGEPGYWDRDGLWVDQ